MRKFQAASKKLMTSLPKIEFKLFNTYQNIKMIVKLLNWKTKQTPYDRKYLIKTSLTYSTLTRKKKKMCYF